MLPDAPLPILCVARLGVLSLHSIIPRLPFASNHLGISEDTTVALLCCLMELFDENPDNARSECRIVMQLSCDLIMFQLGCSTRRRVFFS